MIGRPASHLIDGPAGLLECVQEEPAQAPMGLAIVAHPHPLHGGTMDNKVVHTLCRAFVLAGWRTVRFNYRGVGRSEGAWDEGLGETEDMLAVLAHHQRDAGVSAQPLALAGFSFGGYVAAQACQRLMQDEVQLVLVSPATSRFQVPDVPAGTLVVEGEEDDVVPLASILAWARPQSLPVTVVPGAGHFFHGKLTLLRELVMRHLRAGQMASSSRV